MPTRVPSISGTEDLSWKCVRDDSLGSVSFACGKEGAWVWRSHVQTLALNTVAGVKPAHQDKEFLLTFLGRIHRLHDGYLNIGTRWGKLGHQSLEKKTPPKMSIIKERFRGVRKSCHWERVALPFPLSTGETPPMCAELLSSEESTPAPLCAAAVCRHHNHVLSTSKCANT